MQLYWVFIIPTTSSFVRYVSLFNDYYFVSCLKTSLIILFIIVNGKAEFYGPCCLVAKSCPTLLQPRGLYSPPCSSIYGIFQARILEWVAISFSRGSSWLRDRTPVCNTGGCLYTPEPSGKPYGLSCFNYNRDVSWIISLCLKLCFV